MLYAAKEEVARQLCRIQQMQVVQPSKSPWASPVVLVQKKDGSHRNCIAYRGLNGVAKADNYPFDVLMTSWTSLARLNSFRPLVIWQIRVHPDSQAVFSTP